MTQFQKAATIIALALFFAGAVGMEIWQSSGKPRPSSSQPPTQIAAANNEHETNPKTIEERQQTSEEALAYYTKWLMFFTAVLAVATAGLGYVTTRQLHLARAEYISTHRPRIVLRDVYLIADTIHYTLVNLGGTPATIIQSCISDEFVEDGMRWKPLWPAAFEGPTTRLTFSGGESRDLQHPLTSGVGFAIRFPDSLRIGIENRPGVTGKVYFIGALIYEDSLGMKRRSIFRRRWNPDSLTFVRLTPEQERDHEYAD
jgi:hypothetical protein